MSTIKKLGFLNSNNKSECLGCGACAQACPKQIISFEEDNEGFKYPKIIDSDQCINCGMCHKVCPIENPAIKHENDKYVFGGYSLDKDNRNKSTSGGIFFEIAKNHFLKKKNVVVYGATSSGLEVFHEKATNLEDCKKFRKSKYSQSDTKAIYLDVRNNLNNNKQVIFSGTPCQIAALRCFLLGKNYDNLLTVEVVCEGVPSPLYLRKRISLLEQKKKMKLESYDYRCKSKKNSRILKWDFQMEEIILKNSKREKRYFKDRWFNPFWSIWLQHLMSRPSCYECPYTEKGRVADITLGDLWGVHIYCPELYGKNGGSSLIICNTEKGKATLEEIKNSLFGHELNYDDAIRYQGPLKKHIESNPKRDEFMQDLINTNSIKEINKKWAKKPTIKLLFFKYIYGNRQIVAKWNLFNKINKSR